MYPTVLLVHSWLRWLVIVLGLLAIMRAIGGARHRRSFLRTDERLYRGFVGMLDLQLLLGVILYFGLSPITKAALSDFMGAMRISSLRFWAIEHWFGMIIAIALAHIGLSRARRLSEDGAKHRTIAIFFILAIIAILASIPWPGTPNARPLIRW